MALWLENILLLNFSFFAAFGIYHKSITKICACIGALVYIILFITAYKKKTADNLISKNFLNKFIILFLGAALISVLFSHNINHSQRIFFQKYILFFWFFYVGAFLSKKERNFKVLISALLLGSFIFALGGVHDILRLNISKDPLFDRLYSSFGIPSLFGTYFLYTLPFFCAIIFFLPKNKVLKLFLSIGLIFVGINFIFHYSRAVWISFLLAFPLITALFTKFKKQAAIFVLIFLMIFFVMPYFKARLFSHLTLEPEKWGDRVQLWKSSLEIFAKYPVVGAGPGMYEKIIYKLASAKNFNEGTMFHHHHAHNMYLEILAEMGMLGLSTFLLAFIVLFRNFIRRLKVSSDVYLLAFTISILAVLINELTSSTILVGFYSASLFWLLVGMSVGRISYLEKQKI